MKAATILIGAVVVATGAAVWFGRHAVFSALDRQEWAANHPTYGPPLRLGQRGLWEWAWPRDARPSAGEAQFKIVLFRHSGVPFEHYDREKTTVRLHVSAYQESASGRKQVVDARFPGPLPDVGSSYAFSSYSDDVVEHTLGTVYLDPAVQTTFVVEVETPDPALERGNPRIMVVGAYDPAIFPFGGILLLVRDVLAAALALAFLAVGLAIAWPRSSHSHRASGTQGPKRSR